MSNRVKRLISFVLIIFLLQLHIMISSNNHKLICSELKGTINKLEQNIYYLKNLNIANNDQLKWVYENSIRNNIVCLDLQTLYIRGNSNFQSLSGVFYLSLTNALKEFKNNPTDSDYGAIMYELTKLKESYEKTYAYAEKNIMFNFFPTRKLLNKRIIKELSTWLNNSPIIFNYAYHK